MSNLGGTLKVGFGAKGVSNCELRSRMLLASFKPSALVRRRDLDRMLWKNFMLGRWLGGLWGKVVRAYYSVRRRRRRWRGDRMKRFGHRLALSTFDD